MLISNMIRFETLWIILAKFEMNNGQHIHQKYDQKFCGYFWHNLKMKTNNMCNRSSEIWGESVDMTINFNKYFCIIWSEMDDWCYVIQRYSNIPISPAYGVFISQLIRYARACSSYGCFILRATRLSNKLLEQGYVKERLNSSLKKFYGRYRDLIKQYEVSLSQMLNDILWPDHIQWQPPTDQTLYRTRPFTEFWVVSIEHLRRVWHADRGRLLLRIPGPVPLGFAYVLLVETNPFPNLSLFFRTMLFEYPSVPSRFYFC